MGVEAKRGERRYSFGQKKAKSWCLLTSPWSDFIHPGTFAPKFGIVAPEFLCSHARPSSARARLKRHKTLRSNIQPAMACQQEMFPLGFAIQAALVLRQGTASSAWKGVCAAGTAKHKMLCSLVYGKIALQNPLCPVCAEGGSA